MEAYQPAASSRRPASRSSSAWRKRREAREKKGEATVSWNQSRGRERSRMASASPVLPVRPRDGRLQLGGEAVGQTAVARRHPRQLGGVRARRRRRRPA